MTISDDELIERIRASLAQQAEQIDTGPAMWSDYVEHAVLEQDRPPSRRPSRSLVALAVAASLVVGLLAVRHARRDGRVSLSAVSTIAAVPTSAPIVAPSSAEPPDRAVPNGFRPRSVTYVSPSHGFVLGSYPCEEGCETLVETVDGGSRWHRIGTVPSELQFPARVNGLASAGVRFADDLRGWIYGPGLFETTDGGTSWARVALPDWSDGDLVSSLETAAGQVDALIERVLPSPGLRLVQSRLASSTWTTVLTTDGSGAARSMTLQKGEVRIAVESPGGVQLVTFRPGADPERRSLGCDTGTSTAIAAYEVNDVTVVCSEPALTGRKTVRVSHDGGLSFRTVGSTPTGMGFVASVAMADPRTIVVAGSGGVLVVSLDGGQSWTTIPEDALGGAQWHDLGFTTEQRGVAVLDTGDASRLLQSIDGGRTWNAVTFSA